MWRAIRRGEVGEPLLQRNGVLPTSAEAFDLVANANIRPNLLRHLAQEREGASLEAEFSSGIGDRNSIAIPNSDAMVVRLPTLFVVNVTEKDEEVEIAFFPEVEHGDEQVFKSILFDRRELEIWIDLRGYYGEGSFVTDFFVRPFHFSLRIVNGQWNASLRFFHNTRRRTGMLVGRVLAKLGKAPANLLARDFTMNQRLLQSETNNAVRAEQVPRLDASTKRSTEVDVCAIWVHGTLSCGLEGLKDLPILPQIPIYRFEHDTFLDIGENASQLCDWIRQLGYKRIYLLAHSRGGLVARYAQQMLSHPSYPATAEVMTFGTPHLGTPIADAAAGGLALFMRAGDYLMNGIPYSSMLRQIAGMFVGFELPPGIAAMRPESEVVRMNSDLLHQPFTSWAGIFRDGGPSVGYGFDVNNVAQGVFGPSVDHDLVVPTLSALGGNAQTQIWCGHSDYFKDSLVQQAIAALI
jgi:pimeloyl-ACP methyl ester carboxylesterase